MSKSNGKGSRVDPIRDLKAVQSIQKRLSFRKSQRDCLLFTLGVNNGLRAGDLLNLKIGQVRNAKIDEQISIVEQKTGKSNFVHINKKVHKVLKAYLKEGNPKTGKEWEDTDYLFPSNKGNNQPLGVRGFRLLVKDWCKQEGLSGNFGTHSLRKTWGYQMRVHYGVGISTIASRFNHEEEKTTRAYLGISTEEVNGILSNNVI